MKLINMLGKDKSVVLFRFVGKHVDFKGSFIGRHFGFCHRNIDAPPAYLKDT